MKPTSPRQLDLAKSQAALGAASSSWSDCLPIKFEQVALPKHPVRVDSLDELSRAAATRGRLAANYWPTVLRPLCEERSVESESLINY